MPIISADEDSDMYGGGEMPAQDRRASPKQAEALAEDMETAILPKSILMGKEVKPGDSVILKIMEIAEDQVIVAYDMEEDSGAEEESDVLEEEIPEIDDVDELMT